MNRDITSLANLVACGDIVDGVLTLPPGEYALSEPIDLRLERAVLEAPDDGDVNSGALFTL